MDGQPTFTVVIAAYQAAAFIGQAIESALEQEPPPAEIIVGDDGSTDDLAGAVARFGDAVKVVRIEHGGEGAAKNAAVAAASAEFVAFLDADDRFLPGRLAAIGSLARERPDLDAITTNAYLVQDGLILGRCYEGGHRFSETGQRAAILRGNFVLGLSAVRRERFDELGGFDTSVAYTVDWEFWIRLIFTGSTIGYVGEPLAEYRLHPNSMSARRAAMSRGRLDSIARTEARTDLSEDERRILAATRRSEEARLVREELKQRLLDADHAGARRAGVRLLFGARQPRASRVKALASVVVPAVAARKLRREEALTFASVGDRRLPRPTDAEN
ncbi:MAG TPA: glycosyltransferase [Gaiellaceae bacterium]|nr:glycosyltransferase [Gaiellaceae bacterium]